LRAEIERMKKERDEEQVALRTLEQEEKEAQSKKRDRDAEGSTRGDAGKKVAER
jgi:hypothetical protein